MEHFLFFHGFMGCQGDWEKIQRGLSAPSYALCLPGHFQCSQEASVEISDWDWSSKQAAEALLEPYLKAETQSPPSIHPPIHLVGYSMGGRLALNYAYHFPERVKSLTLLAAHPGIEEVEEREARQASDLALAQRLLSMSLTSFLKEWYAQALFRTLLTHPSFPDMLERRKKNHPESLAKVLRLMGTGVQPSFWPFLETTTFPVTYCVGSRDAKYLSMGQALQKRAPHVSLKVFEGIGHCIPMESPNELIAHLETLVEES